GQRYALGRAVHTADAGEHDVRDDRHGYGEYEQARLAYEAHQLELQVGEHLLNAPIGWTRLARGRWGRPGTGWRGFRRSARHPRRRRPRRSGRGTPLRGRHW